MRRVGEDQAWLARGFLTLNPAEAEWLDKSLFEISRERVREAVISPEGSDAYTLTRADPAALDFTLADLPKGREALSSSALNGVGSALEGLAFEDVVAQGSIDFSKASRAAFTTFEGLTVVITIAGQDGEAWATFTAIADPSLAVPEKTEAPAPAEEGTAPEEGVPPASEEAVPPSDEAVPAEPVPAGPDIAEEAKRINALTAGVGVQAATLQGAAAHDDARSSPEAGRRRRIGDRARSLFFESRTGSHPRLHGDMLRSKTLYRIAVRLGSSIDPAARISPSPSACTSTA